MVTAQPTCVAEREPTPEELAQMKVWNEAMQIARMELLVARRAAMSFLSGVVVDDKASYAERKEAALALTGMYL
jgi:hypothetical protein